MRFCQAPCQSDTDRAERDVNATLRERVEYSAVPYHHLFHRAIVRQHSHHETGGTRLRYRGSDDGAFARKLVSTAPSAIVNQQLMARFDQIMRHSLPHIPQSDESSLHC
jgi:hypothetical protein